MELTAAPLALGYALGRVGCFLVNDDYGIPSTLPWAMQFPAGLPPTTVGNLTQMHVRFPPGADPAQLVAVHPTQIYETVLMLLAFWWLWRLREHSHAVGWRFGVYLVLALAGGEAAEHRNPRRPLAHARPQDPRLLKFRDPLARKNKAHVVEHRPRQGKNRLERSLHPKAPDPAVADPDRPPAEENARRHWA